MNITSEFILMKFRNFSFANYLIKISTVHRSPKLRRWIAENGSKTIVICLCLVVIGCSNSITSHVSVFHEMPYSWASKSIRVLPFDPALKSSLEWKSYKNLIEVALDKRGFNLVRNGETSDYVAFASYGIDFRKTSTSNMPVYGQTDGGTIYPYGPLYSFDGSSPYYPGLGFTMPSYGVNGIVPVETTIYSRNLALDIIVAGSLNSENVKKLYEGRVISRGSCENLPTIIPFMITSLFKEFPGSGGGRKTIIDLPYEGSC